MGKQSLIIFLIIFIILEFFNLSVFVLDPNFPTYKYNQLTIIKVLNITAVISDFALIVLIIIILKFKNVNVNKLNLLINITFFICLFVIWIEIFYSSFYYYGGIGNHQGLPIDSNNLGLIGSIVIIQYFIILAINKWIRDKHKKIIFYLLFFILNIYIHYELFKLLTPL